jgi:serine/threonine-protein kinase
MAPEQMRSTRQVDVRADVWSLGIVLYEALTGAPPFVADSLTEVCAMILTENPPAMSLRRPNLPPQLEAVVARCLEKMPEGRFADVADLAAALGPFAPPHARMLVDRVARVLRGGGGARSQQAFAETALGDVGSTSGSASGSSSGSSSGGASGASSGSMPVAIAAAVNATGGRPAISRPATPPHPIPETLATFGRTDGHGAKPRSVLPYVIAALVGALAIVLITILAVTKLGGDKTAARGADTAAPVTTPAVTTPAATTPAVTAPVVTAPAVTATTTDAPAATSVAVAPVLPPVTPSTTHTPAAGTAATAHTKPSTPTTKPTVATNPATKPSATTASKPAPLSTTGFGGRE